MQPARLPDQRTGWGCGLRFLRVPWRYQIFFASDLNKLGQIKEGYQTELNYKSAAQGVMKRAFEIQTRKLEEEKRAGEAQRKEIEKLKIELEGARSLAAHFLGKVNT